MSDKIQCLLCHKADATVCIRIKHELDETPWQVPVCTQCGIRVKDSPEIIHTEDKMAELTCQICGKPNPNDTFEDKTLGCKYDAHTECKNTPARWDFEREVGRYLYGE